MMQQLWPRSLFGRLVVAQVAYGIVVAVAFAVIAEMTHSRFHLRATQEQARNWAMELLKQYPILGDNSAPRHVREQTLGTIGKSNPGASLYLLDPRGVVLGSSIASKNAGAHIDVLVIETLLNDSQALPIQISDPRDPAVERIFSAAVIGGDDEAPQGYLVMLLSGLDSNLFLGARADMLLSESLLLTAGVTVPALATALILLFMIVRPVRRVVTTLSALEQEHLTPAEALSTPESPRTSELERLNRQVDALAARLKTLIDRLRQDDRSMRQLFADLSHDLRTPLTLIEGHLETLLTGPTTRSPGVVHRRVNLAITQTRSLARMVDTVFELALLQRPEYRLSMEVFLPGDLLDQVAIKHGIQSHAHGIAIHAIHHSGAVRVLADRHLIERVLDNLVDNALRHAREATRVEIEARALGQQVEFVVRDDGVSTLPASARAKLATDTAQMPSAPDSRAQRSGLGLNIVRRILELHGSQLSVTTGTGPGTAFAFRLGRHDGGARPPAGSANIGATAPPTSRQQ